MPATTCTHPPERLYSWMAYEDAFADARPTVLCVACCVCGTVLRGA